MTKNNTKIEQCSFEYQCPKTWGKLLETNIASVRFCDSCERNVYLSPSADEAQRNAEFGRCVAIPIELTWESRERSQTTHTIGILDPPKRARNFDDRNFGGNATKPIFFGLDGCKAGWFCIGIADGILSARQC